VDRKTQLQFRLLTQDAQRSAIRRLALKGLDDEEIAQATGWSEAEVRRVLEPPVVADFMTAILQKTRRSGSSGNPVRG
jgi:transcription initiation factor IIE alpha subunit